MSGFKINQKVDENMKTRLHIEGAMDEHSDYSTLGSDFTDEVVFDMENVKHINSTGIKHWVKWVQMISSANPQLKFSFINTPKCIIDQINMVDGFLPTHSTVKSFKVPFYCEDCDEDKTVTFVRDREFKKVGEEMKLEMPEHNCPKCGTPMEPDVVEQKYFRFLKDQ